MDMDGWTSPTNFWMSQDSPGISWLTWTWMAGLHKQIMDIPVQSWDILARVDMDNLDFTSHFVDNRGQSWDILAHVDMDG